LYNARASAHFLAGNFLASSADTDESLRLYRQRVEPKQATAADEPVWAASGSTDARAAKERADAFLPAEKAQRASTSAPAQLEDGSGQDDEHDEMPPLQGSDDEHDTRRKDNRVATAQSVAAVARQASSERRDAASSDDDEPPGLAVSDDDNDRPKAQLVAPVKPAAIAVRNANRASKSRSASGLDALAVGLQMAFGEPSQPNVTRVPSVASTAAASAAIATGAPADATADASFASGAASPAGSAWGESFFSF